MARATVQRTPRDFGTPEAQKKRLALVVNKATGKAGDPDMAFCELGRLCEQGILDPDKPTARRMYDAGMTLLGLWRATHKHQSNSTLSRFVPTSDGEYDPDEADADWSSLRAFFGPTRTNILTAVINCAVYDQPQHGGKMKKLRHGLHLIIEWQKQKP